MVEGLTSLILFESDLAIGQIVAGIKKAINTGTDVAVSGIPDIKTGRLVGNVQDNDLFDLWDWIKKA